MTITLNPTEIQYEEDLYDQNSDQEMSEKETAEEDVAEDHFVVDVLDSSPIITGQDSLIVSYLGEKRGKIWLGRDLIRSRSCSVDPLFRAVGRSENPGVPVVIR